VKKSMQDRKHCNKLSGCWQYEYMVEQYSALGEIYRVCRKCLHFNPQEGGIIDMEILDKVLKKGCL